MKKTVFIFGLSGRMGQEVAKIVNSSKHLTLLGGFNRANNNLSLDSAPDFVIDFSLPEAFDDLKRFMEKYPGRLVSGTTGYTSDQKKQFEEMGQHSSVFWAANMSFGVYLMCQLTQALAQYDKLYDFSIEETHHIHKQDKPSGTALIIEEAARRSSQIKNPIISIREGEAFGEHRFVGTSKNEVIEIRHKALNRSLFAQGALDIGQWLLEKPTGFYKMDDFFKSLTKN